MLAIAMLERQGALLPPPLWRSIKDGDDDARRFFDRHYSRTRYADGRQPKLFVGPGEKVILAGENWLTTWRCARTIRVARLAKSSGVTEERIRLIESGEEEATAEEIAALAPALYTTPGHIEASRTGKRPSAVRVHRYKTPQHAGPWRDSVTEAWNDAADAGEAHRDREGKVWLNPLTKIEKR